MQLLTLLLALLVPLAPILRQAQDDRAQAQDDRAQAQDDRAQARDDSVVAQSLFGGLPIDGIHCDREEGSVEHIHTQLQLFNRGHAVTVPAQIGIPQSGTCLYWLHTHNEDGFIHIESPVKRVFTLGEFFDIWGPDLSWTEAGAVTAPHAGRLSIWINGAPWHGRDPRGIVLRDHETIVIQSGPPFAKPAHADWSKL